MQPLRIARAILGTAALVCALATNSCYYDPYYYGNPGTSVSATYSSGYGYGYGYGGSSFNTSVFVSTGDPRWGYDPYCRSYYDYTRRCYYDPFMHGYYPIGYRPPVLVGVPHPVGWRTGYCPPPRVYRDVRFANYHDRAGAYRSSRYDWAQQVQNRNPRTVDRRPSESRRPSNREETRPNYQRPSGGGFYGGGRSETRSPQPSFQNRGRSESRTGNRNAQVPKIYYNTPVSTRNEAKSRNGNYQRNQSRQVESAPRSESRNRDGGNGGKSSRSEETRPSSKRNR